MSPRALVSEPLFFRTLVRAAEVFRSGAPLPLVRAWVGGEEVSPRRLLPVSRDRGIVGWRRRLEAELRGERFAVVVNALEHVGPELVKRLRPGFSALFERTGIPPYGVELGAFVGDYEATPFGVHQDRVGVWMTVLRGRKVVHVWRPEVLPADRAAEVRHRFEGVVRSARTFVVERGAWAYWPARHWHVARTEGFAVSLNVGFGTHGGTTAHPRAAGSPSEIAAELVERVVAGALRERDLPGREADVWAALEVLERAAGDGTLRRALEERMRRFSGALGVRGPSK